MIIRKGITKTPGLVIDDKVVSLGRVPSVIEIKEIIEELKGGAPSPPSLQINVIAPSCGCETTGTMIFPCSGGSNVGQVSNDVAKMLVSEGKGKFSCLAGIGAHGEGFISAAKKAKVVLAIDGCGSKCAFKALEHAGVRSITSFVVTDIGIKKDTSVLEPDLNDVKKVARYIIEKM